MQYIVVLRLSPKDTRLYSNTLSIRSLPGVNFWVFHPRDLISFLICLSWAFTFHHHFIIIFFSFHATFQQFFYFSFTQPWCIWNTIKLHIIIHEYPRKFSLTQISIKHNLYHNFYLFPIIPIIFNNQTQSFSTIKLSKTS